MFTSSFCTQVHIMLKGKGFKCAMGICLVYCCGAFLFSYVEFAGFDLSLLKDATQSVCFTKFNSLWEYFALFYPFLVALPFGTSYIEDRKNRLASVYVTRSSWRDYLLGKLLAAFSGTMSIIAFSSAVNLLLCLIFFPHNNNTWFGEYQMENYYRMLLGTNILYNTPYTKMPFLSIYLKSPLLYTILYDLIFSAFSGLVATFALSITFIFSKHKFVAFLPLFIIFRLSGVIDTYFFSRAIEQGDIYTSYDIFNYIIPTLSKGQSFRFIGIFVVIILLIIVLFTLVTIKRNQRC